MSVMVSPGAGRVLIATGAGPLVAEPSWTRYDNMTSCKCFGYDCFAGRQSELDTTDTGSATVYFYDQNRTLDDDDLVGLQIMLQLYNPVLAEWQIRWRGHIDDIQHNLVDNPGGMLSNVQLTGTGIFDYLGGVKMLPGTFGDAGSPADDVVFYEDESVNDRFTTLMADAGLASTMNVIFSGNVNVNETLYDPDDVILQACRDAADAEFPGIANWYEDRFGRAVSHGRLARFDPTTVAASVPGIWLFTDWNAATREDVTSGVAQVTEFSFNRPRARIINSYLAYPRADETGVEFDRSIIPTLLKTDATSIAAYGYRGVDAPDLIIQDNFNNSNTGAEECALFGSFYVTNYANPKKAVQSVSFTSKDPTDARAAGTWLLMTKCDISDRIALTIDEAGLAGEQFYIDGVNVECRVANPSYDFVTVTPNLTPADYFPGSFPTE